MLLLDAAINKLKEPDKTEQTSACSTVKQSFQDALQAVKDAKAKLMAMTLTGSNANRSEHF